MGSKQQQEHNHHHHKEEDFTQSTWISLLGLLGWKEFFVSVDQTSLWRRHIAWSKPKGKEIKDYTTQRFSSNMVFLSLLLGANMNVLFNSADHSAATRSALKNQEFGLKYCIGAVLIVSAFVSILGLVATFTAWGMISSISDCNAHSVLRSSMGQYVTSLPSRFVVGALYLFLCWIVLIVVDMVSGPFVLVLLSVVAYLFFQVVVSLSAFGRLIIHTGAMGRKRVLDPELERQLLPSGLHASLLIKATERCRRRTSVHTQYTTSLARSIDARSNIENGSNCLSSPAAGAAATTAAVSPIADDLILNGSAAQVLNGVDVNYSPALVSKPRVELEQPHVLDRREQHRRKNSSDSIFSVDDLVNDINFPRPSILNQAAHGDLFDVVQMALSKDLHEFSNDEDEDEEQDETAIPAAPMISVDIPKTRRRLSTAYSELNSSTRSLLLEWEDEEEVRGMYDIEPPQVPILHELAKSTTHPRCQRRHSLSSATTATTSTATEDKTVGPKQHRRPATGLPPLDAIREDTTSTTDSMTSLTDTLCDEESPLITKQTKSYGFDYRRSPPTNRGKANVLH